MKKWNTLWKAFLKSEEDVKCFLCTRRLRPLDWNKPWKKLFLFWMPPQYEIGFIRPVEDDPKSASVFSITTCRKCGLWAHENPLAGEMLANARMESIKKYGED